MREQQVLGIIYLEDAYRDAEGSYLFLKANQVIISALLLMLRFVFYHSIVFIFNTLSSP